MQLANAANSMQQQNTANAEASFDVFATASGEKEFAACVKAHLKQSHDVAALQTTRFKLNLNKEPGHYLAYPRYRLVLEKHSNTPSFNFYAQEFPGFFIGFQELNILG
jgi:hypothetical protein